MTPTGVRPDEWSVQHTPAAATQATISKAAVTNFRHVCTGFTASIAAVGTASGIVTAVLRDGATGAGTILWTGKMNVPIGGCAALSKDGLNVVGTKGTAMTLEFTGAGAAATEETVSMQGYTEPA
jgi:hypothetical protein